MMLAKVQQPPSFLQDISLINIVVVELKPVVAHYLMRRCYGV